MNVLLDTGAGRGAACGCGTGGLSAVWLSLAILSLRDRMGGSSISAMAMESADWEVGKGTC